jgi:MoxR-like ATPase
MSAAAMDKAFTSPARGGGAYYTGKPSVRVRDRWKDLPPSRRTQLADPDGYLAGPGLVDAVNVALVLGQPLLLTGEPGTGKTQLAFSLAYELGLNPVLKFEVKSTTRARDLFYSFDALSRFQADRGTEPSNFVTLNALGLAILLAAEHRPDALVARAGAECGPKSRSVVLIDEIDKAPRDVPNDILNEIEEMYFRIPELGSLAIEADRDLAPIIILTSNSEKALPDAFLRRCVYYNIPFPTPEELREIVHQRLGAFASGSGPLVEDTLTIFHSAREPHWGLRKRPGTVELLNWLLVLRERGASLQTQLRETDHLVETAYPTLFKTGEDQARARQVVAEWKARK